MTEVASEKARRGMVREALAEVLLDRAAWTYARLHAGRDRGIELHEETITQDLLLDIAQALPAMSVRTFSRKQESRNGADWQWEWWFHGFQWFGLRVQAKRLKVQRNGQVGYDLGYLTGRHRSRQVDLLINRAQADGVQAAYVLYNGPGLDLDQFKWRCGHLPASTAFFGVSILPAAVAQDLVNAKTMDLGNVGALSRPWSCLASCDPFGGCHRGSWPPPGPYWPPRYADPDFPDFAWWVARNYFRLAMQARYGQEWGDRQERGLNQRVQRSVREGTSEYVAALLYEQANPNIVLPDRVSALTVFSARNIEH